MLANRFRYFYFGFLTAIFALTILSVYIFKQNCLLMNISLVDDYDKTHIYDKFDDNEKIKSILPVEILKNEIMFEDDIKKTMNYIATVVDGRYVPNPNLTAFQKLSHILTQNGGGICGDMAMILKEVLEVKGYKARTIQLIRQLGSSYDTHVVTEVFDEKLKKYILLDPTFNLMFKSSDKYINANEVRQKHLYKKNSFEIIQLDSSNVAKYREYYVDYMSLYNNVLIVKSNNFEGIKRLASKLPLLHNYFGRKYFIADNQDSKGIFAIYNLFYVYLPLLLVSFIYIIFVIKKGKK